MRPAVHFLEAPPAVVPQDRRVDGSSGLSPFRLWNKFHLPQSCPWEDNDRAITPSIRVKEQPKSFDEKVAQKVGAACYLQ